MARHLKYFEFNDTVALECDGCGWSGYGRDVSLGLVSLRSELCEVTCPRCHELVAVVPCPTHQEVRDAAAAGDPRAIADLEPLERREAFLAEAAARELRVPDELPAIDAASFELTWDHIGDDTVILHGEREIWRERAYFEGSDRFVAVYEILRQRYGDRMVAMVPTGRSQLYLGGDHYSRAYRELMAKLGRGR